MALRAAPSLLALSLALVTGLVPPPGPAPATPAPSAAEDLPAPPAFHDGTYQVDPVHSSVVFAIGHMGVSRFYGRFNEFSGSFTVDSDQPGNCAISLKVDAGSVDTANGRRDAHVRSDDFLDTDGFPVIAFESELVERLPDGSFRVAGHLTFMGQRKPLEASARLVGSAESERGRLAGVEARFTVRRSEFGITYGMGSLSDEVELIVSLQGRG